MSYQAQKTVEAIKEHTCLACETVYRYTMRRAVVAEDYNREAAEAKLGVAVAWALRGADLHPCPTCGLIQPEMVGPGRWIRHQWGIWLGVIAVAILAVCGGRHALTTHECATWGVGLLVATAAIHAWAARNPNADLSGNRRKAQSEVAAGAVTVVEQGNAAPRASAASATAGLSLPHVAIVLAGLGLAASPILLQVGFEWPLNSGWYPAVVGPGDTSTYYLTGRIRSIKGFWEGRPLCRVRNAGDLGLDEADILLRSERKRWGFRISVKKGAPYNTITPFVTATFPPLSSLAGKTARLAIGVEASFPVAVGSRFEISKARRVDEVQVCFAGKEAGSLYVLSFWVGLLGGGLLITLTGWRLGRAAWSGIG